MFEALEEERKELANAEDAVEVFNAQTTDPFLEANSSEASESEENLCLE